MASSKGSWQFVVLLAALAVWSIYPLPLVASLLLAYVIALVAVNVAISWTRLGDLRNRLSLRERWAVLLLAAVAPLAAGLRELSASHPWDQFDTVRENLRDRLYLERTPSIAPSIVVSHQPQRFVIHAPGGHEVAVRWTPTAEPRACVSLGHGVFLLDHDPREFKDLATQRAGTFSVTLLVDGEEHQRQLTYVSAQPHPRWLHGAAELGLAATVSEETDELILVRRDGSHRRIPVDDGPTDSATFYGGLSLAVSHRYSQYLWIINIATGQMTQRVDLGKFQTRVKLSPDAEVLAVASDGERPGVHLLSTASLQETGFVPLEFSPDWLEFGRDATELVVTDRRKHAIVRLRSTDKQQDQQAAWRIIDPPILLPRPVVSMSRAADGKHLLLATTLSLVGSDPVPANHLVENTIHQLDLAAWRISGSFVTDRRGLSQDSPGDTEHGVSPLGLAEVDGKLLVTCAGSNEVAECSLTAGVANQYLSLNPYPLSAPHGIADLGDGAWCVASPSDGAIGVFDRDGELRTLIRLAANDEALAQDDPATLLVRRGERTFYEGTRAGLSCQSCHTHGDSDFARHDIGQGVAPSVLSVRGIAGTSPYLRDGSHGRLRDLHDLAESGYRGYMRSVEWDRSRALAAYMESLPLRAHAHSFEPPQWNRMQSGLAAMVKAHCTRCHAPPAMTNLGQHPVSLLFPEYGRELADDLGQESFVDTPSLRGLAGTPPYLHDGRAATLREVLVEHNRANRHGDVQSLKPNELADLIYLLERL